MRKIRGTHWMRLVMSLVLTGAACSGDATGPAPVALISVSPAAHTMFVGEEVRLTATVKDAEGRALVGRAVAWSVEPASLATVTADGKVTGAAPGVVQVAAESEGKRDHATITIQAKPPVPVASLTLNTNRLDLDWGHTAQLLATPRDANGSPLSGKEIIWSSTNPAIAAVTNLGQVIARGGGTATITATSEGKSDAATVVVTELPDFAFDLIYDRWSGTTRIQPTLYRVDIRTVDAIPHSMLDFWTSSDATASPNGDRIAFVGVENGHTEIFVANTDGSNAKQLTSGTLSADQPAWSPDGTRIAYRLAANFSPARIWVMNADGANQHAVTNDAPGEHHHPTWSPRQADGSYRIAYAQAAMKDGYMRAQIWSVRDDGTDRQIHSDESIGAYDDEPSWSPDGRKIVFVRSGQQLVVVTLSDRSEWPLMNGDLEGEQHAPAWSPDGSLIAFVSSHQIDPDGYGKQIYTVRADGSGLRRRTFDNAEKGNPGWIRAR
jgi:Tol biopolymer transport system component